MQKRKLKLNIIDIAIVVVVLCSIAVIAFRDTIGDFFGKPDIMAIEVEFSGQMTDDAAKSSFVVGTTFGLTSDSGVNVQMIITNVDIYENGDATIKASLNGYKKLGRFYAENGDLLEFGNGFELSANGQELSCALDNVEFQDAKYTD